MRTIPTIKRLVMIQPMRYLHCLNEHEQTVDLLVNGNVLVQYRYTHRDRETVADRALNCFAGLVAEFKMVKVSVDTAWNQEISAAQ